VPTVVKLRGRVIKFSAFLWGYVLVIQQIFFTTDTTDFKKQRICIKFCFNPKKLPQKPTKCYRKPSEIMSWAKAKFFYGTIASRTDKRSGQLSTSTTPENTAKVREVILADHRQTIHNFCEIVGLSYGTVTRILADSLNMRRISARFVPRLLSDDQKALSIFACRELNKPATTPSSSPIW